MCIDFDTNKIVGNLGAPPYKVKYYIYKDDESYTGHFTEEIIKNKNLKYRKNTTTACFSQLSSMLYDFSKEYKGWPNRLLFLCNFKHCVQTVTYEETLWWIITCKKYKLLPEYIDEESAKTGNFILKIDVIDLNSLYIYLSSARYLQDDPHFIKAIKYLVDNKDMDFHVAFAIASRCCICGIGHHIIPVSKQYPYTNNKSDNTNNINNINTFNLSNVIQLKKFLENTESIKKVKLKDIDLGTLPGHFNLHKVLSKINVKKLTIKRKDLTSKETTRKIYE